MIEIDFVAELNIHYHHTFVHVFMTEINTIYRSAQSPVIMTVYI